MFLALAKKSNGKIDEKTFRSAEKKVRVVTTADLTYKGDGKFRIAGKFLTGQEAFQGWNVSPDLETKKAYLVKVADVDREGAGLFLKGDHPSVDFKSLAVEYAINSVGISLTKELTLTRVEGLPGTEGFHIYEIGNAVESIETEGEAPELEIPTDNEGSDKQLDSSDSDSSVSVVDDSEEAVLETQGTTYVVDETVTDATVGVTDNLPFTQEQVDQYAQEGVEETPTADDVTLLS